MGNRDYRKSHKTRRGGNVNHKSLKSLFKSIRQQILAMTSTSCNWYGSGNQSYHYLSLMSIQHTIYNLPKLFTNSAVDSTIIIAILNAMKTLLLLSMSFPFLQDTSGSHQHFPHKGHQVEHSFNVGHSSDNLG